MVLYILHFSFSCSSNAFVANFVYLKMYLFSVYYGYIERVFSLSATIGSCNAIKDFCHEAVQHKFQVVF